MISGVIAEFNPFHNGHAYLLNKARENSEAVIVVMSGNFVQRGDIAIFPKHLRAKMALLNGADLIISLPAGWSMSGAENFAYGGISLLKNSGIIDRFVFGCETDSIDLLTKTAKIINCEALADKVKKHMSSGVTYALARQKAVEEIDINCSKIITSPNNILATEYISSIEKLMFTTSLLPVKRVGVAHDSNESNYSFASASNLRNKIFAHEDISQYIPESAYSLSNNQQHSDFSLIDTSLLFKLRSLSLEDIMKLPDISEGIENRIFESIKSANSVEELCKNIKTKRYTYSRIKRIIMSACFGIDNSYLKKEPPYIHILGVTEKGQQLLADISKKSNIPVIKSSKDISSLDGFAKKVFEVEATADDLYGLAFKSKIKSGSAYTLPLVKTNM